MRLNPAIHSGTYSTWLGYQQDRAICRAIVALKEASSRGPNFLGTHNVLASSYLLAVGAQQESSWPGHWSPQWRRCNGPWPLMTPGTWATRSWAIFLSTNSSMSRPCGDGAGVNLGS